MNCASAIYCFNSDLGLFLTDQAENILSYSLYSYTRKLKPMKRHFFIALSVFFLAQQTFATSFTPAQRIQNQNSTLPKQTADLSRLEGWTFISYYVDINGRVKDAQIIDSSNPDKFGGEALFYLDGYRYSPAKIDGIPVESAQVTFFTTDKSFNGNPNDGISRGFKRYYNDADNFILKGNMEKAKESLDTLLTDHAKNLTEQALATWQQSLYYFKLQDWPSYGSAVKVAYFLNNYLPVEMKLKTLQNRLQWHAFKREFSDALYVLNELKIQSRGALSDTQYLSMSEDIKAQIKASEPNKIDVTVANGRAWSHRLPRSTVNLTLHEGNIDFAELRCENGRHLLNPSASEAFTIPDSFFKCSVFVKGADGTRFSVTESGETRAF